MIISFHMHFISVLVLIAQSPCLSLFDNDKGGEDVYELIILCFSDVDCFVVDCGFFLCLCCGY